MKESRKRFLIDLGASVFVFLSTVGMWALSVYCLETVFRKLGLGASLGDRFFGIRNGALFVCHASTMIYVTKFYCAGRKAAYLEKLRQGFLMEWQAVLGSPYFWTEFVTFAVLAFLLPMDVVLGDIKAAVFPDFVGSALLVRLFSWLILILLQFFDLFFVFRSVHKDWQIPEAFSFYDKKKITWWKILLRVFLNGGCFLLAAFFLPAVIPVVISFGAVLLVAWPYILIAFLIVSGMMCVRVFRKQCRFLKRLHAFCEKENITLTMVKPPYLSVFNRQKGYHFTFKKGEREYRCKLVASVFRSAPMFFTEYGAGAIRYDVHIGKVVLFHIMSQFDYSFESEEKKLIIVLPSPAKIFAGDTNGKARMIDTGEILGAYQIFSGSGFIGALERNCIGNTDI